MTISRRQFTLGIVFAAVAAIAGGGWLHWRNARQFAETRTLLSRFPAEEALVLHIDFTAVRAGGLLADSNAAAMEPEYKQFVQATGFDYRRDLDSVTASFSRSGNFYIARGRFDWGKLRDYAAHSGGSCYQDLCRMPGSTPERRISFLPLRDDVMAMAVSTDDLAANRLTKPGTPVTTALPSAPAWLIVPGASLHDASAVPPGLRLMLSALTNAEQLVITVGVSASGLAAKLDATCRTKDDAHVLASQLRTVTATLKEALAQDKDAQSDELVKVLLNGTFDDNGVHVSGEWPFSKALIAALTSGI